MNIKSLQGKKVEVKKSGKSALKGDGNDAPVYFEFADAADSNDKIFRPLVSSLIDGETRLGPEFTSSVVVQDNIVELPSIAATDANDLPVREKQNNHQIRHSRGLSLYCMFCYEQLVFAYNPKPQLSGMRVHSLPIGSKSTLQKSSKVSQKAKKDESVDLTANDNKRKHEEVVLDEDKSSKKKKKKQDK